jgi:hypothetical protein
MIDTAVTHCFITSFLTFGGFVTKYTIKETGHTDGSTNIGPNAQRRTSCSQQATLQT